MRLRRIKLSGFKSFVDPTAIVLPGELVGIVGPNGCGKSNVIDAVRWVMGEISAKHLRGDSMEDVVFNGSNTRKPVGQASVELIFDNSAGTVGGRFAAYNEIAVRRVVPRGGQSAYSLNGTRCRRRDVMDVFLGTGLGPRSYSIIEQGMISRLIEAKPDELREFLEEAAGISKYKERRRETSNRIRHTQENLDRLNDLRDELDKRLDHLKRQARQAERYRELKQEERLVRGQLLALRWRALDGQASEEGRRVAAQETALEEAIAAQRETEATLERSRAEHAGAQARFNDTYRQVLDAGAEIARVEESIQNLRNQRQELAGSLEVEEQELAEANAHLESEAARLAELEAALAEQAPELGQLEAAVAEARAAFERDERAVQALQSEWESLSERAAEPARAAEAERARIAHLEERIAEAGRRRATLVEERASLADEALAGEIAGLADEVRALRGQQAQAERAAGEQREAVRAQRESLDTLGARLDADRQAHREARGRLASLQALQQDALGKQPGASLRWLERQGIEGRPRLAEDLEVEPGWELALELVLGFHLESVCVDGVAPLAPALGALEEGRLGLLDTGPGAGAGDAASAARGGGALADKVRRPGAARALLAGVGTAESVTEALALRGAPGSGAAAGESPGESSWESIVTRDGVWLGPGWARAFRGTADGAGVISREQEMRALGARVTELEQAIERAAAALDAARARLATLEDEHASAQDRVSERHRALGAIEARLAAARAEREQVAARAARLDEEIGELAGADAEARRELAAARARLERSSREMARLSDERGSSSAKREAMRGQLDAARERLQGLRDEAYQAGLRAESTRTRIAALEQSRERNLAQAAALESRCADLRRRIRESEEPLAGLRETLERRLTERREREAALASTREEVEAIEARVRDSEQRRQRAEARVSSEREALDGLRMHHQETRTRRQGVEEQVGDSGHALADLLADLPDDAAPDAWEERLEGVERRIARLGPINLAAIEEFEQQSERKEYLDRQHADLTEALATLDEAIRRIDRETRTRFRDTYEKVNDGLARTFPRLFGGGSAYLQMTGDDLLSTGIAVMAQPPGKRNTNIHLLSGGEKALAAVALVFAIFELKPAPFCLLDEVDAPLDDANVGRFCELVREMSERVQFVIVTHNKTTMEMTQQLIGVTMNEPGVSRLVAVDVDEAVELAAV